MNKNWHFKHRNEHIISLSVDLWIKCTQNEWKRNNCCCSSSSSRNRYSDYINIANAFAVAAHFPFISFNTWVLIILNSFQPSSERDSIVVCIAMMMMMILTDCMINACILTTIQKHRIKVEHNYSTIFN